MNAAVTATLAYYDDNADAYFQETANLDNSDLLSRFLELLPFEGRIEPIKIADIGCGSGRDLKVMLDAGHTAIGIEPAARLAALARQFSKAPVIAKGIADVTEIRSGTLAGAWACSSLLHIPAADLPDVFSRIHDWLIPGGVLFTCFKDGAGETTDPRGRTFTNLTLPELRVLAEAAGFEIVDAFPTESIVPGRTQVWNNIFLRRIAGR